MQEITTKNTIGNPQARMAEGEIRPNETTTVYSTGSTPFTKAGAPMEVHAALAEKLIAAGKATKDAPAEEQVAKAKATK